MAGYYDEITGKWVETGDVGQLPGPLPETTGTGDLPGWTVNNGVWTDPSGATYDLSYLDSSITPGILNSLKNLFSGTSPFGPAGQFLAAAGLGKLISNLTGGSGQTGPAGYRGGIPEYVATRTQTPMAQQRPVSYESVAAKPGEMAPAVMRSVPYRPGQGGITYFNPIQYEYMGRDLGTPKSVGIATPPATPPVTPTTPPDYVMDGTGGKVDTGRPAVLPDNIDFTMPVMNPGGGGKPTGDGDQMVQAARGGYMPGGIAMLAGGRYLRGPGDGVSDSIPAKFERSGAPARLADGEFVIDARTVSEIGNGSSEAGARKLYAMMDRVHKARKTAARGKPSGADKFLPK